ncbi:glycosyltransferase [Scytonema millei]|uniref:Glycosyltransferase n=1 Tax=Scytonema millei VB511283 TaxID=1245923 RepID=A0A9X5I4X3_9CYAN|nr:glycosyltransferase [Scytonema millei]NHC35371.1 glycosyltransferase [Scytonema millei VB511283]
MLSNNTDYSLTEVKKSSNAIDPLPPDVARPMWSVMIPIYNRTTYLEQAIASVIEQTREYAAERIQIELIDNCSTNPEIEFLIQQLAKQHRISVYRQPQTVSMVENLNTCIRRARGQLIHILHDDDIVLPGFYQSLEAAFTQEPSIGAAYCRHAHIDENDRQQNYLSSLERSTSGIIPNFLKRIAVYSLVDPPAMVVKRSVYEHLGGFRPELYGACDHEMWRRIAAHYPIWFEPQVLACFRVHSRSQTSAFVRTGKNIVNMRQSIETTRSYLPKSTAERIAKRAMEECALYALRNAFRVLSRGDLTATKAQIREALKCSCSLKVIAALFLVPFLAVASSLKRCLERHRE